MTENNYKTTEYKGKKYPVIEDVKHSMFFMGAVIYFYEFCLTDGTSITAVVGHKSQEIHSICTKDKDKLIQGVYYRFGLKGIEYEDFYKDNKCVSRKSFNEDGDCIEYMTIHRDERNPSSTSTLYSDIEKKYSMVKDVEDNGLGKVTYTYFDGNRTVVTFDKEGKVEHSIDYNGGDADGHVYLFRDDQKVEEFWDNGVCIWQKRQIGDGEVTHDFFTDERKKISAKSLEKLVKYLP